MRIKPCVNRRAEGGGALLITLLVTLFIGVTLGSYLILVSTQNRSVMRSMSWNGAIAALEAGIEEALTHIHHVGVPQSSQNGWTLSDGWYQRVRTLGDGSAYVVRIQPVSPPVIVSTGVGPAPLGPRAVGSTEAEILAAANDSANFVRRTVRVTTRRDALFAKGMVAKGQIDLRGNTISSDSFNSTNAAYSTGGKYDPAKRRDNGDIATNSGLVNSLNVGNANIMGHVSTGPGGSIAVGPSGTVGTVAWVSGGNTGIMPGYSTDDMNVAFDKVEPPFTMGTIPGGGSVAGTNYTMVLGKGDYVAGTLSGKVVVTGTARIYLSGGINLKGTDFIYVAPGASLEVYAAGPSTIGGNGVANATSDAYAFRYYGLETSTSLTYMANASFTGVIYAPYADFTLGGGGNNIIDFIGSSITSTVIMNGHFNFHYDESLADRGPSRGFIPVSWNEMRPGYGLASSWLVTSP